MLDPSATRGGGEHGAAEGEWLKGGPIVEPGALSAYNQSRGRFLGVDVEVADFTVASLEGRLPALTPQSGLALWIVPFRGISRGNVHVPIDLVYLDKDNTVLDLVEYFPVGRVAPSSKPAASLLALPADTISSVEISAGDQLLICGREEMKRRVRSLSNAVGGDVEPLTISPKKNWLQRLFPSGPKDLRKSQREAAPGLVAHFFTGGAPVAHEIRDISTTGVYIITGERWYLGTILRLTFSYRRGSAAARSLTVNAKVVRWGNDGVGFEFILLDGNRRRRSQDTLDVPTGNVTSDMLQAFLDQVKVVKG